MNPVEPVRARQSRRLPAVGGSSPAEASPEDQAWESDLLSLLCALETWRTRLSEYCQDNQAVPALDAMLATVRPLATFLDRHQAALAAEDLARVRQQLDGFNSLVRQLRNRLQKTTLQKLLRLLVPRADEGDPHDQFVASAQTLHGLLFTAFEIFTAVFHSPAAARGWNDARQVFLADLQRLVEQLQR